MNLSECIEIGAALEMTFRVGPEDLAQHLGTGSLGVLATPRLIGLMERVSHLLIARCLPEGYSSVGVRVDMRHLAATPPGFEVRVRAEVLELNGYQVRLKVQAWDDEELAGECEHSRFVIEEARFLKRVQAKLERRHA